MATLSFVTPEEHQLLRQEVAQMRQFVTAFIESIDDDVDTATALKLVGIKSRTTLIELRETGAVAHRKEGTRAVYSRASCIAYKLRHTLSDFPLRLAS